MAILVTMYHFLQSYIVTSEDENSLSCEGEVQTNQNSKSCSVVREWIKLDSHHANLLFTTDRRHCLPLVVNTHPCCSTCGEIKEHISWEQFTHSWGQRTFIVSGFPHGSVLIVFSACFARSISGRFNIVCILSMIKYLSMVWSHRAVQSCVIRMHQHDPSGVSYFLHLCAILPSTAKSVVTSSFLSFYLFCFVSTRLTSSHFNSFFECCSLFSSAKDFLKGKCLTLYDITVFCFVFLTEDVRSRSSIVLPCFVKWQSGRNTVGVLTCS